MDKLPGIFRCVLKAFAVYIAAVVIFSVVAYIWDIGDNYISAGAYIVSMTGIFLCSFMCGKKADSRGALNGIAGGMIFYILLIVIRIALCGIPETGEIAHFVPIYIFCGAAGGITGINMK